jgi:hypothetical protein
MTISLVLLLLSFVLPFVVGPILIHRRPGINARQGYVLVSEEAARQRFPTNSFRAIAQLEQLGFSLAAHMVTGDELSRANLMISLLVNRDSKIMVTVNRAFITKGPIKRSVDFVVLRTEFEDGTEIVTTNTAIVGLFREVPRRRRLIVPQLGDVYRLHYIHSYYVAERNDRLAVLPAAGEEVAHFQKIHERSVTEQESAGYFYFDEPSGRYRFTWLTAISFAWRAVWPVRPMLMSHKRYRGRLIAKTTGITNL